MLAMFTHGNSLTKKLRFSLGISCTLLTGVGSAIQLFRGLILLPENYRVA